MILERLVVGPFESNCWIVACDTTLEAAVIDPGDDADRILQVVEKKKLTLKYLIHTHGHLDHVGAMAAIKKQVDVPALIHEADAELLDSLPLQASMFGLTASESLPADQLLHEGDHIVFGQCSLRVIETPGHSPGGICLEVEGSEPPAIFTGDTLFRRSIGRTDLWAGSYTQLIRSIRDKLWSFADETLLHPGHGPTTTMGDEKHMNPYLQGL